MANQYVNKVVQSNGTTIMDISDTTATAADVASGKYFYSSSGAKTLGTAQFSPVTPVYTSSTGLLYTPVMTINMNMERTNGFATNEVITRYGQMPYLEELTLVGTVRTATAGQFSSTNGQFSQTKFPMLKKLHLMPDELRTGNGGTTENQYISFGHYIFNGTNLTELTIGKLNGPYYYGGGYFRSDLPNPPTSNKYAVGSVDGLTIKIYVDAYKSPAAGFMSSLAPNTTVIQYDYLTGEVLTA